MSSIGKRIRELREQHEMSQQELADRIELSRPAISEIESDSRKVSAEELVALAGVFRVSVDYIVGLEGKPRVTLQRSTSNKKKPPELRINVPQRNVDKFKEVLIYILNKVGAKPNIGETVLYKLFYFIDFDYYEKYEEQLIGATYIKKRFGPLPVEFQELVSDMVKAKQVVKIQKPYFDYQQKKYLPLRRPDLSKLTAREIAHIDDVLNRLSDMSGKQISEYSHNDIPWRTTDQGKRIEYESVFYRTPEYSVRGYEDDEG